ncbi:MAG: A24 family peptidase [Nanoarchaeota archaeon]|nr:A24 family peptidase [Nanoarchaeota archaeon]
MFEIIFLVVLALVWLVFASIQDLKKREVANWINFSLIIFALGFRFFYSLFNQNFNFLYQGLIGLGVFFILGNLFYYSKLFAGGDAKLIIALGAVLPFSDSISTNLKIFLMFILLFLFLGGFYGFIWSIVLSLKNFNSFKKEFTRYFRENKIKIYFAMCVGLMLMILGFLETALFFFGALIFFFSYLYVYTKAVDESCMVKRVFSKDLAEGDWLYEDVKIKGKLIKANWVGLSRDEISMIRKYKKKIKIRRGIPFVPVFLISFLILIYLWFFGFGLFLVLSNLF